MREFPDNAGKMEQPVAGPMKDRLDVVGDSGFHLLAGFLNPSVACCLLSKMSDTSEAIMCVTNAANMQ